MDPQRPVRPVGIVLSAVALGLAALVLLLLALGGLATALSGAHLPAGSGAAALPSAAVFTVVMLVMTLVYLGLGIWSIATLVGLLRMRSWARISAMVIAGGLACLSLLSAISMLGMQAAMASGAVPVPPNLPPGMLHKLMVTMAAVSFLVAGLSIAWLVYLALRRTRDAFAQAEAHQQAQQFAAGQLVPGQFAAGPSPAQPPYSQPEGFAPQAGYAPPAPIAWPTPPQPPQRNPLTDFTVARPVETAAPFVAPVAEPTPTQPPVLAHLAAIRSRRPVSITVLAIIALFSAFFSLFGIISPEPAFLFGALVSGWPLHLYSLVWAAAAAIAGLGMLRLQRPAWVLSFILLGVSSLHFLVLLLPGPRARYMSYLIDMQQHSRFGGGPALPPGIMSMTVVAGMLFGLAVTVGVAILLWRARWAFALPAPPASTPSDEPESPADQSRL